jgi:hypothetical protein
MHIWLKTLVVHFSGFERSVYWVTFPSSFLRKIHSGGFKDPLELLEIKHTRLCNLLDPDSRTEFILDFIALVLYIADGRANVGQLRRPGTVIHRTVKAADSTTRDEVVRPPQAALDDYELANWLQDSAELYGS